VGMTDLLRSILQAPSNHFASSPERASVTQSAVHAKVASAWLSSVERNFQLDLPPRLLAKRMQSVSLKFFRQGQQCARVPGSNPCGACVVAMLIDRSTEEILRAVPDSENPDYFWLNYMSDLGFFIGGCPK
jgi:hypothetical protein